MKYRRYVRIILMVFVVAEGTIGAYGSDDDSDRNNVQADRVSTSAKTLYHYRARAYDSTAGRFLQRDPHTYIDGMNTYEYVVSRPCALSDPAGKQSLPPPVPGPLQKPTPTWPDKNKERPTPTVSPGPAPPITVGVYSVASNLPYEHCAVREQKKLRAHTVGQTSADLADLARANKTCISKLAFYGHGSRGRMIVGDEHESYDDNSLDWFFIDRGNWHLTKQICGALCDNAQVEMRGCNVGMGWKGRALMERFVDICGSVGKQITVSAYTGTMHSYPTKFDEFGNCIRSDEGINPGGEWICVSGKRDCGK